MTLLVGGRIVVRVPRFDRVARLLPFAREAAAIAALRPFLPLPVPDAVSFDGDPPLMAYPLLPGRRMRAADATEAVAAAVAALLAALHAVPPATIAPLGYAPGFWTAMRREQAARLDALDLAAGERATIGRLLADVERDPLPACVTHHDVTAGNLLVDGDPPRLAGIVDFTDLAIEDPHWDFRHLADLADGFLAETVARYRATTARPISLDRIRRLHRARPAIDLLKSLSVDHHDGVATARRQLAGT